MDISIRLGNEEDIDELEALYNELNDYLAETVNYPGWRKGIYPIREDARVGIEEGNLYVAIYEGKIIGSVILRHKPEPAYLKVKWQLDLEYEKILVIYTFVVHPRYLKHGVGKAILDFIAERGSKEKVQAIRLDVYEKNIPAIRLYEKCGFKYIDTVDLGLANYGLEWFKLYEKLLYRVENL